MATKGKICTEAQLNSIRYLLKSNWKQIYDETSDSQIGRSILYFVDNLKLIKTDTRTVREGMELVKFDEKYISEIQNRKTNISNIKARGKYNESVRLLKKERSDLAVEKGELEDQIIFYKKELYYQHNYGSRMKYN